MSKKEKMYEIALIVEELDHIDTPILDCDDAETFKALVNVLVRKFKRIKKLSKTLTDKDFE